MQIFLSNNKNLFDILVLNLYFSDFVQHRIILLKMYFITILRGVFPMPSMERKHNQRSPTSRRPGTSFHITRTGISRDLLNMFFFKSLVKIIWGI